MVADLKTQNFRYIRLVIPLLALILSTLACAEKYFDNTQVYSAEKGTVEEFYDTKNDKILADNVWVFKPDGTYSALINIGGQKRLLSGKYGGDNLSNHEFAFSIDTNNDGQYDDNLWIIDGDFAVIEWRREDATLRYFQITPFP